MFEDHTDTEAMNHAISAALSSGVPLGTSGYELDVKYLDPVYDTNRDMYVDPVTRVESPAARAKRLVEESRMEGY